MCFYLEGIVSVMAYDLPLKLKVRGPDLGGKREVKALRLSGQDLMMRTRGPFAARGFCGEWHVLTQIPPPAAKTPPSFDDGLETGRRSLVMGRDRDGVGFEMN